MNKRPVTINAAPAHTFLPTNIVASLVVLAFFLAAGCQKDGTASMQPETKREVLTKAPWTLSDFDWETTGGPSPSSLQYEDLSDCERRLPYKFGVFIVAPLSDAMPSCNFDKGSSGIFQPVGEHLDTLRCSLFTGKYTGVDNLITYHVVALDEHNLQLNAHNFRFGNDSVIHNIRMIFVR